MWKTLESVGYDHDAIRGAVKKSELIYDIYKYIFYEVFEIEQFLKSWMQHQWRWEFT